MKSLKTRFKKQALKKNQMQMILGGNDRGGGNVERNNTKNLGG